MRKSTIALIAFSAAIAACTGRPATGVLTGDFGSFNGASVALTEEGGIAALSSTRAVRHDDRFFSYVQRHICATVCPTPLDTASGSLSAAATDSLFTIVFSPAALDLESNYGTTPNSADMISYTLTLAANGNTKVVRADDGTMPAPMRQIVNALHGAISAARH
ncbi:MAG TPA: hypothetical protein VGM67_18695 [Gemmatimonadaceae bacterium]|jgi:hypothetical protein